ncbi:MAG TPA: hypothetical protein VM183_19780 [Burkholderiales bacterium]|nr:hypothetical protein [Burkholderiales bacterium]
MSRIICGRFDGTLDADATLESLKREGFSPTEVDAFYVSPPGQNSMTPVGGDAPHSSEGSQGAGRGALIGAALGAAAGLIVGAIIGGDAVLLATALGALVGAFAGTMTTLRGGRRGRASVEHPVESRGGRMIAVCVDRTGVEALAINTLRAHNARDVGRTEGEWRDGSWRDFDPRRPLATV